LNIEKSHSNVLNSRLEAAPTESLSNGNLDFPDKQIHLLSIDWQEIGGIQSSNLHDLFLNAFTLRILHFDPVA
jgi:hypothetical protein